MTPLAIELGGGWTLKEIAGLVFVGAITWFLWIKFRQMQFPESWEHGPGPSRDPKEKEPGKQDPPSAP